MNVGQEGNQSEAIAVWIGHGCEVPCYVVWVFMSTKPRSLKREKGVEGALFFDVKAAESLKCRRRPHLPRTNDPSLISNLKTKYWVYLWQQSCFYLQDFKRIIHFTEMNPLFGVNFGFWRRWITVWSPGIIHKCINTNDFRWHVIRLLQTGNVSQTHDLLSGFWSSQGLVPVCQQPVAPHVPVTLSWHFPSEPNFQPMTLRHEKHQRRCESPETSVQTI